MSARATVAGGPYGGLPRRPARHAVAQVFLLVLAHVSRATAAPLKHLLGWVDADEPPRRAPDQAMWLYLAVAAVLVLLGGAFAGLTIALMGQDGVYLQVIATSGEGTEQRHAQKVYHLLQKGKHWVLVTLLLSNVIVNETLPIILDRSLGGGWPAVLGSTLLIVIFGEVIPQSICVRYGLAIGAYMAPPVLGLMWLMAPIAWPTAKLLDYLLGEDHGTVYKKSGLKTLVTLHKTLGASPTERLNQDEVTIISAVLDLKDKAVGDIMTPMEDVFTMSADTVLDEDTMNVILSAGYSRIPIFEPDNRQNFVGMLLVKILITYDPEDCKKVSEFALATLPETRPETSCLDIVNFFQEGKSHMVLVSERPGENHGAIGVVTLEDVIEELIGEEIIDESDVYIDVHKAIRRMTPAPKSRAQRRSISESSIIQMPEHPLLQRAEEHDPAARKVAADDRSPGAAANLGTSPKTTFLRRSSSGMEGNTVAVRGNMNDMREHLKHLGPSNLASRPKSTRYNTVKIKSALTGPIRAESRPGAGVAPGPVVEAPAREIPRPAPAGGEGEGLVRNAGKEASDGVMALHQGYGSFARSAPNSPSKLSRQVDGATNDENAPLLASRDRAPWPSPARAARNDSEGSQRSSDTLASMHSYGSGTPRKRGVARSGSITENVIHSGGFRKIVLQTTSAGDEDRPDHAHGAPPAADPSPARVRAPTSPDASDAQTASQDGHDPHPDAVPGEQVKKKRRRTRKKKSKTGGEAGSATGDAAPSGR